MRRKWLTEEIELLKKLYSDSSPSQLESILGRNYLAISQQAKRLGLLKSEEYQISRLNQMRIKGANVKFTKAESKVSNHQCFASMNSSSAYWLGFLAADGFIENKSNRVVLNLGKKDIDHLLFFKAFVGGTGEITERKSGTMMYSFSSRQIHTNLVNFGVVQNRNNIFQYPTIPRELDSHFLRGFIDGDGWVLSSYSQIGMIAGKVFLERVKEIILEFAEVKGNIYKGKSGLYNLLFQGRLNFNKLHTWIMKDAEIYLERKWNI